MPVVEHNTHYTLTQGEAKTLRFYLEPTDATTGEAGPVDLTLWTVLLTITQGSTPLTDFTDLACTNDADQVNNKSVTRCALTALQTAALPSGNLKWYLNGTDGSSNPFRFPNTQNYNTGTLKVWPA